MRRRRRREGPAHGLGHPDVLDQVGHRPCRRDRGDEDHGVGRVDQRPHAFGGVSGQQIALPARHGHVGDPVLGQPPDDRAPDEASGSEHDHADR